MEENQEAKKPDEIIDKSGNKFKSVNLKDEEKKKGEKSNKNFAKKVGVPFLSGALGATLVLGVCFGVPSIKTAILGKTATTSTTSTASTSSVNTTQISLTDYSDTGVKVANTILPSIVGIKVQYSVSSNFTKQTTTATAQGSGIIMSEDGYILTNNHVINSSSSSVYYSLGEATTIKVYLYNDDTAYDAKVIGTDEVTDLAVIKIEKTGLTAVTIGDSDSVQVGEFAMAVGNPLGLQSTITSGMVSAVNREVTDDEGNSYTMIQTDAAINSGNSGGALVDSEGKVIGINSLKASGTGVEGIGFAIPINTALPIYEQLVSNGKVVRPYIGISGRNLTEETAKINNLVVGVYVSSVEEFSAAEKAGIKAGDVIVKVNGESITTMTELNNIKNKCNVGDTITITVNRNGTEKEIQVVLSQEQN